MPSWLRTGGARQAAVLRETQALTPEVWARLLAAHDFLGGLADTDSEALRQRAAWILASKSFHGAHGLTVTPSMRRAIAVQAALPILGLDTSLYHGWTQIVVYPGGFLVPRIEVDEAGVVHEYTQETSGESWEGGPVILSWDDVHRGDGANVVIHEFAHKLDQRSGGADGMPGLRAHPGLDPARWQEVLAWTYEDFNAWLDEVEAAIPAHIDPESDDAAPWYEELPLDPYAATDPAEFFAVSSEGFFVDPEPLARAWPDWYGLLAGYYRQDPLRRLAAGGGATATGPAPRPA